MVTNFENSEIYKKARKEYQDKIYWAILKPMHSIIIDEDEVYLFYVQWIVDDIFNQLNEIYEKDDNDFPISLWYENPVIETIVFMWTKYRVIKLWYDNCEVPNVFKAKF